MSKIIMGIQLQKRHQSATHFQDILTEYGCYINTRLGVHHAAEDSCSEKGLILLEFIDNADKQAAEFEKKISSIENVVVRKMEF
jgi:hypothetical protein